MGKVDRLPLAILITVLPLSVAGADTIWHKSPTAQQALMYDNVKIEKIEGDSLVFVAASGNETRKKLAEISRIRLDDEPALNAAEEAFDSGNIAASIDWYRNAAQATARDWVAERAGLRLMDAARITSDFGAAVDGFVLVAEVDPDAAEHLDVPIPPNISKSALAAAVGKVKDAEWVWRLKPAQSQVLSDFRIRLLVAMHEIDDGTAPSRHQLDALTAENHSLLQQVEGLKKQIDALQERLKAISAGAPPAAVAPPAPRPSVGSSEFDTVGDIVTKLPSELRPTPDAGWDKFSLPKVRDWVNSNVVAQKVSANLFLRQITVDPNDGADTNHKWHVAVHGEASLRSTAVAGIPIYAIVVGANGGDIVLSCDVDEATAKQWDKKREALAHPLSGERPRQPDGSASGTISQVQIRQAEPWESARRAYILTLRVDDMTLDVKGWPENPSGGAAH